jgi:hypothetical protein
MDVFAAAYKDVLAAVLKTIPRRSRASASKRLPTRTTLRYHTQTPRRTRPERVVQHHRRRRNRPETLRHMNGVSMFEAL